MFTTHIALLPYKLPPNISLANNSHIDSYTAIHQLKHIISHLTYTNTASCNVRLLIMSREAFPECHNSICKGHYQ